jgi:oligopeptide/dipeptide ABC transporter ATP-binding protein
MYFGKLVELGSAEALTAAPLHPYTEMLLASEPRLLQAERAARRRIVPRGEIPSLLDPPSGCRFRSRCPQAEARCAHEEPAWRALAPDRFVACHLAGKGPTVA